MAADREVKIRFTGDSANIKGAAGDVSKVFRSLMEDADDARGAGEKLAAAYEQVADSMRKDMDAISEAADVVRDSLGPDMTRAIEATGRTVEDQVQDWRKLGLTLDDITRDSDELARGLRQLDDSARQSTGSVGDGMRKIGTATDNSRSVMANFTGNAVQELPGVTGAMGPLNMAIGQFAEYAAEGNIGMKNFAKAGLGIGAASVAMWALGEGAKRAAERTAQITEAMNDLGTASDEQALRSFMDMLTLATINGDSTEATMRKLADTNLAGLRRMLDLGEAAGWSAEALNDLRKAIAEKEAEQAQAATTEERYGDAAQATGEQVADATDEVDRGRDSLVEHMDATAANTLAQEALTTAFEDAEDAQRELNDALRGGIDTSYAAADAQDQFVVAMETLATATDDPKTGVNELDQAQRSAEQAALAMADANVANAEALAIAAGAPLTVEASNKVMIDSLSMLAASMDENSPVRAALLAHIDTLGGVQPTVTTTVTANTSQAATDIEALDTAAEALNTETNTESNAETQTALEAVTTLQGAVDGLGEGVTIPVAMSGVSTTITDIGRVKTALQQLIDKANEADRAVARVAG